MALRSWLDTNSAGIEKAPRGECSWKSLSMGVGVHMDGAVCASADGDVDGGNLNH